LTQFGNEVAEVKLTHLDNSDHRERERDLPRMGLRGRWVAVAIWLSASEQTVPCAGARLGHRRIAAQAQARPIRAKLQAYLQEQEAAALPKIPLGAAVGYGLRNWVALTRYAEDGRLTIDNNGADRRCLQP
jgi:hypothetical protein